MVSLPWTLEKEVMAALAGNWCIYLAAAAATAADTDDEIGLQMKGPKLMKSEHLQQHINWKKGCLQSTAVWHSEPPLSP